MGELDGRVAIITGAGRGLGRDHALLFAKEGAKVLVNDLGGGVDGSGKDTSAAQLVVDEIKAMGGEAIANTDGVSDWEAGKRMVQAAVDAFGDLHILVNNAGILRDRMLVNMEEAEWDAVINVHLKGTFVPTRHAVAYWRDKAKKTGASAEASVVCTASGAGLLNNVGQTNYGAAKAGIAAFGLIAAKELGRYGVRVNVLAPTARTRLTSSSPGLDQALKAPEDQNVFDAWNPANISPLVAYLATKDCPFSGGVWHAAGGSIGLYEGWKLIADKNKEARWTIAELRTEVMALVGDRLKLEGLLPSEAETLNGVLARVMS